MPVSPAQSESSARSDRPTSLVWFALTTLLSAFLVFQVQPVISKCVLPWFGGTPAVWTTCMLFFQVLLFAGYAYAHFLRTCLPATLQGMVHLGLLISACWTLPIEPQDAWKPMGSESPTLHLLWLLAAHVGLPYFVLSSTGPLLQAWLSYRDDSDRVYRLYALSNVGSLSALLSYPFLIEPWVSVSGQSTAWSIMFCLFVLAQGWLAIQLLKGSNPSGTPGSSSVKNASDPETLSAHDTQATWKRWTVWVGLPAFASLSLLVVTNHVCQDVAVIPFLWVLPLSLYLLSFIICFDSPNWYRPKATAAMTLASLMLTQSVAFLPTSMHLIGETAGYFGLLLGICLLCHGEVAHRKPAAKHLTLYYMCMSGGGALGGMLVAVVCPFLFDSHLELPIMLAMATAGTFLLYVACQHWGPANRFVDVGFDWSKAYRLRFGVMALVAAPMVTFAVAPRDELVQSSRNFFGVLKVTRDGQTTNLIHGSTIHGMQRFGEAAQLPTSYYGFQSGVGHAIQSMQSRDESLRVGVIGLGCGVLASYGRPGDVFDMIEINPDVIEIAQQRFTFLSESAAEQRLHLGDGRLVLERMRDVQFDVLVLDAFSSDAIPAHLLTREAVELYHDRLASDGVIAVHVSNNHLDLVPLVHRLAESSRLHSRVVHSQGDPSTATKQAKWVLMAKETASLWSDKSLLAVCENPQTTQAKGPLWTDQHHNLASVLNLW